MHIKALMLLVLKIFYFLEKYNREKQKTALK